MLNYLTLKMKELKPFETSITTYQTIKILQSLSEFVAVCTVYLAPTFSTIRPLTPRSQAGCYRKS